MKILLVEDDEIITELVVEALNAQNYEVDMAYNGLEAWKLIATIDYDLLLLDLTIPGLDGLTLCRQLRAKGYQMPVLMLTARDSLEDRVAGLEAGADDYLVKPYRLSELLTTIQALLDNPADKQQTPGEGLKVVSDSSGKHNPHYKISP
jgi:two-component system OmpR family response regulator